jgi:hypothetical protein
VDHLRTELVHLLDEGIALVTQQRGKAGLVRSR